MWQLYQFPLCPFSRKVRLLMAEKGIPYELIRENPWDYREEFQKLNPAVRTPVLRDEGRGITLIDSRAICEYLEETNDKNPMINGTATNRAEIRRLVALFDENVRSAREAIRTTPDSDYDVLWSLKRGDQVLMSLPRRVLVRQHINHLIHHRGQLTVYLRLRDVPIPSIYGPTADERSFM